MIFLIKDAYILYIPVFWNFIRWVQSIQYETLGIIACLYEHILNLCVSIYTVTIYGTIQALPQHNICMLHTYTLYSTYTVSISCSVQHVAINYVCNNSYIEFSFISGYQYLFLGKVYILYCTMYIRVDQLSCFWEF